jgi:SRSO17 transposase
LLNHAVWDTEQAMGVVRGFVAEHMTGDLVVGALDESGQQKQGAATAGVKRQYMGCAGRVDNGVNTVCCTYATVDGHALVGARIWVPAEQWDDPARREELGIGQDVVVKTKPQLAKASSRTWQQMTRCPRGSPGTRSMAGRGNCGTTWRLRASGMCCGPDGPSMPS